MERGINTDSQIGERGTARQERDGKTDRQTDRQRKEGERDTNRQINTYNQSELL